MKKHIYTAIAASCAMFASCSQEGEFLSQASQPQSNAKAITEISVSPGVESRAAVSSSDNTKINWQEGDALKVFGTDANSAAASSNYTISTGVGTTSGLFTNDKSTLTAIQACMYPAQQSATWDGTNSKLTCTIPTVQTAVKGSFDKSAAIMYSIGNTPDVQLQSAVNFFKVTIRADEETDKNVHAITVYNGSTTNSALTGQFNITKDYIENSTDTKDYVTLQADDANGALAPGDYYIAVRGAVGVSSSYAYSYSDLSIAYKYTDHTAKVIRSNDSGLVGMSSGYVFPFSVNFVKDLTREAVQLWENGPYFATVNVGQTETDYSQITTAEYTTANVGGLYTWGGTADARETYSDDHNTGTTDLSGNNDTATKQWGAAWRMPTSSEMTTLSSCKKEACYNDQNQQYASTCALVGVKFSGGYQTPYSNNNIFLPAAGYYYYGVRDQGTQGFYWSSSCSTSDATAALSMQYQIDTTTHSFSEGYSPHNISDMRSSSGSVRAVLR